MHSGKKETYRRNERVNLTKSLPGLCNGTIPYRDDQVVPSDLIANKRRVP